MSMSYLERRLEALDDDVAEDEIPPTEAARATARRLLAFAEKAFAGLEDKPRTPAASTLGGGDLEFSSTEGNRTFFLSINPDGVAMTQWVVLKGESAGTARLDYQADEEIVVEGLRWVHGGREESPSRPAGGVDRDGSE